MVKTAKKVELFMVCKNPDDTVDFYKKLELYIYHSENGGELNIFYLVKAMFSKSHNFSLHIPLSWWSHMFAAKHATELCVIPF